jgi:ethanolamine utilization protein EutN
MPASSASWITGRSMQIARVIGTLVATQKHRKFEGAKLMLVQPLNLDDTPRGAALLAIDGVGAGVHEKVLVVLEGRAAGEALGKKGAPVDAAIIGIVDSVDVAG